MRGQDMLTVALREGGRDHPDTPLLLTRLAMLCMIEEATPSLEVCLSVLVPMSVCPNVCPGLRSCV